MIRSLIRFSILGFFIGFLTTTAFQLSSAHADESVGGQVQDAAGDASTSAKKSTRKAKRAIRKATGTDTTGKDMMDKANDAGDDISNGAKKTKNKITD